MSRAMGTGEGAPERAEIVVIGGGVVGTSVAYHLAHLGRTDVVLVEQGQLSGGTTWHAAGLVGQLRSSESGTRLVQYSTQLYRELEGETGLATGWKQCGGVTVARTQARMNQLRRTAATAAAFGLDCELLTPAQAAERYPDHPGCTLYGRGRRLTWHGRHRCRARCGCGTAARCAHRRASEIIPSGAGTI